MIHEEICTYDVCKLAKEKGFPQEPKENNHSDMYSCDGSGTMPVLCSWCVWLMEACDRNNLYAAPTQGLLQRWLREEKGYYVYPFFDNEESKWTYVVREKTGDMWIPLIGETPYYDCFDESMEDALKFVLENLI